LPQVTVKDNELKGEVIAFKSVNQDSYMMMHKYSSYSSKQLYTQFWR